MKILMAMAALAVLFAAGPARADDENKIGTKPGLEFGARGEWYHPKGGTNRWSGGAQLRAHMSKWWALEAAGDYRKLSGADVYPLQGSLLGYLFPDSPVTPFILAGAGWYFVHGDSQRGSSDVWGPHVGGGIQAYLNQRWSIDGTYRYIWIENHHNDPNNAAAAAWSTEGHMVTVGLNYHF